MHVLSVFVRCVEFEEVVVLEIILGSLPYPHVLLVKKREIQKGLSGLFLATWILHGHPDCSPDLLDLRSRRLPEKSEVFFFFFSFLIESISKNRIPAEGNTGNFT